MFSVVPHRLPQLCSGRFCCLRQRLRATVIGFARDGFRREFCDDFILLGAAQVRSCKQANFVAPSEFPSLITGPAASPSPERIPRSAPASWQCRERTNCLAKAALTRPIAPASSPSRCAIPDPYFPRTNQPSIRATNGMPVGAWLQPISLRNECGTRGSEVNLQSRGSRGRFNRNGTSWADLLGQRLP